LPFRQPHQSIRERARNHVRRNNQNGPYNECDDWMRDSENDPLKNSVQKDAHQHEICQCGHAGPHQIAPKAPVKEQPVKMRRSSCPSIGQSIEDAENDRYQWLQHKAESARARKSFWDVLQERTRKQVDAAPVESIAQRTGHRQHKCEQSKGCENNGSTAAFHERCLSHRSPAVLKKSATDSAGFTDCIDLKLVKSVALLRFPGLNHFRALSGAPRRLASAHPVPAPK
jgi:hypothetical protein